MCGLEIQVDDGQVASIRGNRDDAWSRGHICPKGATLGALHQDPDRIRRPMIKVDGNPGGSMFPRAAAWYRTRVRGAKEVVGQVPVFLPVDPDRPEEWRFWFG